MRTGVRVSPAPPNLKHYSDTIGIGVFLYIFIKTGRIWAILGQISLFFYILEYLLVLDCINEQRKFMNYITID